MNQATAATVGSTCAAVIVQFYNFYNGSRRGGSGRLLRAVRLDHRLKRKSSQSFWGTLDVHDGHRVWEIRRGLARWCPGRNALAV